MKQRRRLLTGERLFPERTPPDAEVTRRITTAYADFDALLARHRVVYMVERGENSSTGRFERIVFGVAVPKPEPAKDPVTS
jgi:hypothetical protein